MTELMLLFLSCPTCNHWSRLAQLFPKLTKALRGPPWWSGTFSRIGASLVQNNAIGGGAMTAEYAYLRNPEKNLECLPDAQVVQRILQGECALFELIMRRYNQRLYRVARGLLGDHAMAEDAVQNGYIKAYQSLRQFRGPDGFGAWIARIVSNEALMIIRKQGKKIVQFQDGMPAEGNNDQSATVDRDTPEKKLHEDQLRGFLERAVDNLPDVYRATFMLRHIEQLPVAETAQVLGIPEPTVKSRSHRAIKLIRQQISDEAEELVRSYFRFAGSDCDRMVEKVFRRLRID